MIRRRSSTTTPDRTAGTRRGDADASDPARPLLEIDGLDVAFATRRGEVRVLRDVSFSIDRGESVAVIGESGSGKTTTGLAVLGLVRAPGKVTGGRILFKGDDLIALPERELRAIRGNRIAMISQNPMTALDPAFRVGDQIAEVLRHHQGMSGDAATQRAVELLEAVRMSGAKARLRALPYELSGGMRQRVTIAIALANDPDLLIADEPTTALDVTIQARIVELLAEIQREYGMSMMFITHNVGVAARVATRVVVMYAGRVIETAGTQTLLRAAHHPYTQGLLACVPEIGDESELAPIPGTPVDLANPPSGCPFAERCGFVTAACSKSVPLLRPVRGAAEHEAACIL